ncbi:WD40-repeat-containing domain protein, partial [Chytridium lagenaria]
MEKSIDAVEKAADRTEVAAVSYAQGPSIDLWDIRTGAILASFKTNASSPRCLQIAKSCHQSSLSLRKHLIFSAQAEKPILHIWSWAKDHPVHKFILPEKLSSMSISNSGNYLCRRGLFRRFYLWEIATGRMMGMCDSHFKAIRVVKFSEDDRAFLTGGEDASLRIWTVASFKLFLRHPKIQKHIASSQATPWPVTDAAFTVQMYSQSRVFSVSLDKTLRVRIQHTTCDGGLSLPIVSLLLDPALSHAFAGADNGFIYLTNLYKSGEIPRPFSFNETFEDGTCSIWDVKSRQLLRTQTSKNGPVTNVEVFFKPAVLLDPSDKSKAIPFPQFKRFITDVIEDDASLILPLYSTVGKKTRDNFDSLANLQRRLREIEEICKEESRDDEVEKMRAEIERLKQHNKSLRTANDELYQSLLSLKNKHY